ncbi:MAG: LysR family transcriptional regulator [Hydrogenophilaceae bacterium]|jgi:DNA-binding transcriptional LysR family regulator|nr:LysR family transcriptional regulator [Hydrogenophilaceae bacterium]
MDWDKLKTFHHAAETGSLTAAAEKLGVSQSAVSRQIQALEQSMGVPLFQRHARGLLLTGPGMALREHTREMASAAKIAESALKDAREKVMGDLKVTAPVAFGATWLAPRLVHFAEAFPETRLQLLLDDREFDLLKLEAECAVRLWAATHADLIQRKILDVNVSLYASRGYVAKRGAPQTPEDLDEHRIIAYKMSAPTAMRELDWATRAGREDARPRTPALEIDNVYGMLRAVESGFGIASLPDYMARECDDLVKILPELEGPNFEVYFIYPSDLKRSKRIAAFRQFLIEQAASWPE